MNKTMYRILVMSFALILLATGAYIGLRISDNVAEVNKVPEVIVKEDEPTVIVSKNEENDDIEVTYEDYYINCRETLVNKNIEFGTTKEKIKGKVDKEYKFIEETESSMLFRKEIDSNCPNHFELKLENDHVMIYQIINDEKSIMYKNTEIIKSSIRDELVAELEKGIKVNTLEDLNSFIEDIES